jgi:CRP/FNR family transcriptional regulator, anaerobic regulatory protein
MLEDENQAFIRKVLPFWDKLRSQEQALILCNTAPVRYRQGENIHSGENDCVGILLIKSGALRTYILSEDGREITLFRLAEGDVCVLSASCILKSITFDVHIDAEHDSEVLLINSAVFQQICDKNIYAENFSNKIVVDRFSDVMWAMQQLLFMSFDKRLAIFLLDEVSKNGSDSISLTHEQIANYVGSAREVVSRMLKYFENEGFVKLSRGSVTVIDKKRLRNLT